MNHKSENSPVPRSMRPFLALIPCVVLCSGTAHAGIAYGSINNFDTVNDTSNICHGFEIELDDIHCSDITYTYDYNHYGTPRISEFTTNDANGWHTNVLVRYEGVWTGTGWSAYTAVPTTNIPPTQGHAFTNPSLNFGGEHFGVGYRTPPTKIYYHWLLDDGSHNLVLGPQVNVSTPVFNAGQPGQILPVIPAPVLPVAPPPLSDPSLVYEFSDATWVKVITTTSHTNHPIELRELVTPDLDNPERMDWRNGETNIEVETEWQLLQIDFNSADYNPTNGIGGPNGQLAGKPKILSHSDDVVTYRYEYYAYAGPYSDWDTHQALAESVATDGIHGLGTYLDQNGNPVDLSTVEVVGKFLGAQMSAMAAAPPIGLINHLPDAEVDTLYPTRAVVISPDTNFIATCTGLPAGMTFDAAQGWIGNTPSESGAFIVTISVSTSNAPVLTKNYPLMVAAAGEILPPHCSVDTSVSAPNGGSATGDGVYTNGTTATVLATANPGFAFVNWTENGVVVCTSPSYTFTNTLNQSLVATFVPAPTLELVRQPTTLLLTWPTNFPGFILQQNSDLNLSNWIPANEPISPAGTNYQATILTTNTARFFRLVHP